ncbi:hypothetical protein ACLMAJ_19245 [Nocardia sp. KC 131]
MSATAAVAPENAASPAVLNDALLDRDSNPGVQAGKLTAAISGNRDFPV